MLTLPEFCQKYRISHAKAKRMHKDGALRVADAPSDIGAKIFETLAIRNPLSALELCGLIDDPGLILTLGRHTDKASAQLQAVGDAAKDKAPKEIAAILADASSGDPASVQALADWIKSVLPQEPVRYPWLACRLLLAFPANVRQFEAPRIVRALANVRKLESFAGWFRYEKISGRKAAIYARPIALHDL
jgi:hypothetical protein